MPRAALSGHWSVAGGGSMLLLVAGFFWKQSDHLSQRVAELQERIGAAAGATGTRARSGVPR